MVVINTASPQRVYSFPQPKSVFPKFDWCAEIVEISTAQEFTEGDLPEEVSVKCTNTMSSNQVLIYFRPALAWNTTLLNSTLQQQFVFLFFLRRPF